MIKVLEFNQEECRQALAKMVIIDELPFKFVENTGFRLFTHVVQPQFMIPSRWTVARDCLQLFLLEKAKLKSILSINSQMISVTTDTWTSIQNLNYMCVTGHYIDDSWTLNKKILGFFLIPDHKGDTIGMALEKCLKDWGIGKICTVTVDNAAANNSAIDYLVGGLDDWNCITILNGEFMHMRCCAHILNLIVKDGLAESDASITRIRACCKFVRSSPSRLATFNRCVANTNIECKMSVSLDVTTRWNSTYLMLDSAEKFEKAFNRLQYEDSSFLTVLATEGGLPTKDDWLRARVLIKFLKVFYDATLSFSGSLHVTSNTFFKKLCDISQVLQKWSESNDVLLSIMAKNMKRKLDKYWGASVNMNYLLFVATVLDPRHKLEYVEFCFEKMYGSEQAQRMLAKLNQVLRDLFNYYKVLYPILPDSRDTSCFSLSSDTTSTEGEGTSSGICDVPNEESWSSQFYEKVHKKQTNVKKNELDRNLEDDVELNHDGFDLLKWWKTKSMKYHYLSKIARDILAIPVSTVSSESAFSTGGRILDPFRSNLNPTTVEALICTQNWLKVHKKDIDLRASMDEIEKIEAG